jgi:hypothetical protein
MNQFAVGSVPETVCLGSMGAPSKEKTRFQIIRPRASAHPFSLHDQKQRLKSKNL